VGVDGPLAQGIFRGLIAVGQDVAKTLAVLALRRPV
jgi:hypothetical protein